MNKSREKFNKNWKFDKVECISGCFVEHDCTMCKCCSVRYYHYHKENEERILYLEKKRKEEQGKVGALIKYMDYYEPQVLKEDRSLYIEILNQLKAINKIYGGGE